MMDGCELRMKVHTVGRVEQRRMVGEDWVIRIVMHEYKYALTVNNSPANPHKLN